MTETPPKHGPHVNPSTTVVSLCLTWDASRERTAALRTAGSHAVLLEWHPQHWPVDGGKPAEIAGVVAQVLAELNPVLGRGDIGFPADPHTRLLPPPGAGHRFVTRLRQASRPLR